MSQMINDTLQNVYNRIAQIGKSLAEMQGKLEEINKNLDTKVQRLADTIVSMTENTRKEGEAYKLIIENTSKKFLQQVELLQSDIGLKDLIELKERLKKITEESEVVLKPEAVNVILEEVLDGIKQLTGIGQKEKEEAAKEKQKDVNK
ncbi:MAG: hypothetical protein ACTSRZ_18155 [Promethearchaeota archaeon]